MPRKLSKERLILASISFAFVVILNRYDIYAESVNLIDANKIISKLQADIKKDIGNVDNMIELGVIYFHLKEYNLSKEMFEDVIEIDLSNSIAHYNLGKTLIEMGYKDEGIRECEKSLELGLDDINLYRTLASQYFDKRQLNNSLGMYANIKRLDPNDDMAYFISGMIYIGLGDGWQARREFKKAVELNPNNAEAHYELGWLYADYDIEYAKKELLKAIEINPNHEEAKEELKKIEVKEKE